MLYHNARFEIESQRRVGANPPWVAIGDRIGGFHSPYDFLKGGPMSILSRLFGGGGAKRDALGFPAEDYNGYSITPVPQEDEGGYRVAARIEKEIGGEVQVHHLLRADVLRDRDEAAAVSLRKAKQVIDEQGERIFR